MWFKKIEGAKELNPTNVEIIAHKKATKKTIDKTKEINQNLNKMLIENGFTLKIYLASRAKH